MTAKELRARYLQFFRERGHKVLPNLPIVPENDPTTLFISAGMQPLTPYLLGELHPLGKRIVSLQRCLRTTDIEEVGDTTHHSFFEMLGNWSLGDYFKKEALAWSLEFVTQVLGISKERLSVTIFAGDENAPYDSESENVWLKLGIPRDRIYALPREDNWWEGGGETAPGGPDSEIFIDAGQGPCGQKCRPGDNCGRFIEIWNNVFMEYRKKRGGGYERLAQRNVDTGLGLERTTAIVQGKADNYETELFIPIITELESIFNKEYAQAENKRPLRTLADHLRAATFLIADGVAPGNVEQGYILRRLIRRAVRFGRQLGEQGYFTAQIAKKVIEVYEGEYPHLLELKEEILAELEQEEEAFGKTLARGLKEFEKLVSERVRGDLISGQDAFWLYETFGFPIEETAELAAEKNLKVDLESFRKAQEAHQKQSREGGAQKFAGGLIDRSTETVKLHTATHLLHQALRDVLGEHVRQRGSNITRKRLRFDFSHPTKLTGQEIQKVEGLVNEKIKEGLAVVKEEMPLKEAQKQGVLAFFGDQYGQRVKVYSMGDYSREVCGGPHAENTAQLGHFKITKQESVGKGIRRIKAILE